MIVQAGTYPYAVAAADLDLDGRMDLAVANTGDARISIFAGNGDGTFRPGTDYPVGANWAVSLAVADLNRDGAPDVAASSAFTDDISVLLSKGGGGFASVARYGAGIRPYAITTGDFDGDGKLDLAVANSGSTVSVLPGSVSILIGNGDGSFGAAASFAAGHLPTSIATRDFNRDGRLDLAVANHGDANIAVLLGDGAGGFQAAVNYAVGSNPISIVVADFDGDGRLDLATGTLGAGNTNQVSVLLGNGDGTFQPAINSTVTGTSISAVAGGDFNSDGMPDLALADYSSGNVAIVLGNGDGTFRPATTLGAAGPVALAAGDFDRDGTVDLAIGNYLTSQVSIALGDGRGAFRAAGGYPVGNDPLAIAVADLNGDSKPDLAVANVNDHFVSILQGNGDGSFGEARDYGTSKGPSNIAAGDFDRDGKLDLAMTGYWFNDVSILMNDCAGPAPAAVHDRRPDARLEPAIEAIVPNPARALARVDYSIPLAMSVELSVLDVAGRRVATLVAGPRGPGRHAAWIPRGMLAPGFYWCRLAAGARTSSRSLIVLR